MPAAPRILLLLAALTVLAGCRRTEAEYQKLVEENRFLKGEIERLTRKGAPEEREAAKNGEAGQGAPDLTLTVVDLYSQRADSNPFRARQRLSNKIIRLTGAVDSVDAGSVTLGGVSKHYGPVRLGVSLTTGYAARIREGLMGLERGTIVTAQGKFIYERMILNDALFVDGPTGRTLYSDDLLALSANTPLVAPAGSRLLLAPATPPPSTAAPATKSP
jgi:hypothetical protein